MVVKVGEQSWSCKMCNIRSTARRRLSGVVEFSTRPSSLPRRDWARWKEADIVLFWFGSQVWIIIAAEGGKCSYKAEDSPPNDSRT